MSPGRVWGGSPIVPHARSAEKTRIGAEPKATITILIYFERILQKNTEILSDCTGISIVAFGSAEILAHGGFAHGLR